MQESERVWDSACIHLQRAVKRHKSQANTHRVTTPTYNLGQKDCLSTGKLSPRYIGPFTIQRQMNEIMTWLNLPPQYRITPTIHVSLLKPHHDSMVPPSTGSGVANMPLPPVEADVGLIYTVHTCVYLPSSHHPLLKSLSTCKTKNSLKLNLPYCLPSVYFVQ